MTDNLTRFPDQGDPEAWTRGSIFDPNVQTRSQEIDDLRAENARLRQRIEQLEGLARQLNGAHNEVQRLLPENERLTAVIGQMEEENTLAERECDTLRAEIARLRAHLAAYKALAERFFRELEDFDPNASAT